MVHPTALTGKSIHSLSDILDALVAMLFREYNKDAQYRDAGMPPVKKVYTGEPAVLMTTPALAVKVVSATYADAPQNAGADIEAVMQILCYGREHRREPQQTEAIKMLEIVRHILIDNATIQNASGTEQVYQAGYQEMTAEFDEYVLGNQDDYIGVHLGVLEVKAVFAEMGY